MQAPPRPGGGGLHPLSCTPCRTRKIKCNRIHPCAPCSRFGDDCVFPTRKKNRRPRLNRQAQLLDRLARLEGIVGGINGRAAASTRRPVLDAQSRTGESQPESSSDTPSKYLGGEFWDGLCAEVEGLKQALELPTDSESDDGNMADSEETPESTDHSDAVRQGVSTSQALLGNPSPGVTDPDIVLEHPPREQMLFLASTYFTNVDMLLKVLHRPTVTETLRAFVSSGVQNHPDPAKEAVFFALYFAAITSMASETCSASLGRDRGTLSRRYRLLAEAALAKADYLNSRSIETIQALTIYLACLRSHDGSRPSWALLGLALRLAQGLGLHRDGNGAHLPPFEAEMRRRLWWQLVVLEVRSVEDRGSETLLAADSYNTRMLTNISDVDFGPGSTTPLEDRRGPTDVIFSLATAMSSRAYLELCNPRFSCSSSLPQPGLAPSPPTPEYLAAQARLLRETFIDTADPSHPASALAASTVQIVLAKHWLSLHYPFRPDPHRRPAASAAAAAAARGEALHHAVAVMEQFESTRALAGPYTWYTDTYVQWHALAVALAQLCSVGGAGEGGEEETVEMEALEERAWRIIDDVFARWSDTVADSKKGSLWVPIRKLWKRAMAARMKKGRAGCAVEDTLLSRDASVDSGIVLGGTIEGQEGLPVRDVDMPPPSSDPVSNTTARNSDFGDIGTLNLSLDLAAAGLEPTDWTSWNEFVNDAYAGGSDNAVLSFPVI